MTAKGFLRVQKVLGTVYVTTSTATAPAPKSPWSKDEQDPAQDSLSHHRIGAQAPPDTKQDKFRLGSENLPVSEIALGK